MPLKYGLLRSYQTSAGAEIPAAREDLALGRGLLQLHGPHDLRPVVQPGVGGDRPQPLGRADQRRHAARPGVRRSSIASPRRSSVARTAWRCCCAGSRRRASYGWISYTLSRSERQRDGAWAPYDFDRPHLFNLVAGAAAAPQLGSRPSAAVPERPPHHDDGRVQRRVRRGLLSLRLSRRQARPQAQVGLLDFYVDVTNAALLPEEVQPGTVLRYVLPTVGVRGRF